MEEVFVQLTDEGLLERTVGRGTFVSSRLAKLSRVPKTSIAMKDSPRGPSRRGLVLAGNNVSREPQKLLPFNAGVADTSVFPWKVWCRLQARATRELGMASLSFADPRGLPYLRCSIARYLAQSCEIRCTPDQVIIFDSTQQALNTVARLLLNRGDTVWVEDPGHSGARAAFQSADTRIAPVPVDENGIVVDRGVKRAPRARLAYVMPAHQYPTGVTLSIERRMELLAWATRTNAWIIEDSEDGEFRYSGVAPASLHSLDSSARVFYLGTLDKSMFLSLRLAYMVVPEEMIDLMAKIRTQMDGFSPILTQMTMSLFMDEGYFFSHLRLMRKIYAAKRDALIQALAPIARLGWTWSGNPAGTHLLLRHKNGEYVRSVAQASELDLALLNKYRSARAQEDGLFLRFGALDPETLQAGVQQLVTDINKMANRGKGSE
jgi:GntR family transcriptional regulator/MocR family aminotransferase